MADVTTNVAAVVSIVDKTAAGAASVRKNLEGIDQVAKKITDTVPTSLAEMVKDVPGNIWQFPVRGADVIPDVVPVARAQVDQAASIFDQLGVRLKAVGDAIQRRFTAAFEGLGRVAKQIGGTLSTFFSGLGGLGVGFGIGTALDTLIGGMDELVKTVDKLAPVAANLGISIAELQRLTVWAKEGGVPVEKVTGALQDLEKTLGAVALGAGPGSKRAKAALEDLMGEDWSAAGKEPLQVLREFSAAFQAIDDPQRRAADAAALFTGKWKDMLPLLMQGPEAIDKAIETSKKLGEISPAMQKAAEAYKKATADFATSISNLRMSVGATLMPVLTPAIQELTDFIAANREALTAVFKGAADAVIGFFEAVGPVVKSTADDIQTIKGMFVWLEEHVPQLKKETPVGPLFTPIDPASFQVPDMPDLKKWEDPITNFRDLIINQLKEIRDALQTPLGDIWGGVADAISRAWLVIEPILGKFWDMLKDIAKWTGMGGVTAAFEAVASALTKAHDAWSAWRTEAGAAPTPPALGAPAAGGGPLTWENLAGPPMPFGQPPQGTVNVQIENKNPPPGTRTTATAAGPGVKVDVGQSMPWSAPDYSGPWAPAGAPA